jgi:hypothetical protein
MSARYDDDEDDDAATAAFLDGDELICPMVPGALRLGVDEELSFLGRIQ